LLDIVAKYVEKPEVEKGAELSLAGISQKFTKYTIVIQCREDARYAERDSHLYP